MCQNGKKIIKTCQKKANAKLQLKKKKIKTSGNESNKRVKTR